MRRSSAMTRLGGLTAALLVTVSITFATATGAAAAPSEKSSCAAQYVQAFGPPGHNGPVGGQGVSLAARIPKGQCFPPPFPTD